MSLIKKFSKVAVGLAALVMLAMPGKVKAQYLDDYLSTTTVGYSHFSVGLDLNGSTAMHYYPTLEEALDHTGTATLENKCRVHIWPGIIGNGSGDFIVPDYTELVGQSDSVVPKEFIGGIDTPSNGALLNKRLKLEGAIESKLVNLILRPLSSESVELNGSENVVIYNNHFGGGQGTNYTGVTVGDFSNVLVNNNVFNNLFWSNFPDASCGLAVHGNATLSDNVFANSASGLYIYDTSNIDLGTVENPGNNVFYGNWSTNITATIGDINIIPAELNTWYPTVDRLLQGSLKDKIFSDYIPCQTPDEVFKTILVKNPTTITAQAKYKVGNEKVDLRLNQLKRVISPNAVKSVDFIPFNKGSIRFGAPTKASDAWVLY